MKAERQSIAWDDEALARAASKIYDDDAFNEEEAWLQVVVMVRDATVTAVQAESAGEASALAERVKVLEEALRQAVYGCASGAPGYAGDHAVRTVTVAERTIGQWRTVLEAAPPAAGAGEGA